MTTFKDFVYARDNGELVLIVYDNIKTSAYLINDYVYIFGVTNTVIKQHKSKTNFIK